MRNFLSVASSGLVLVALAGSCSTVDETEPQDPAPVCDWCDVGDQSLRCRLQVLYDGGFWGYPSGGLGYQQTCVDPDSTETEQEHACLDRCDEWIALQPPTTQTHLTCDFLDVAKPFSWAGCVPPEDEEPTGSGQGLTCPSWYSPSTDVYDYESLSSTEASVTVDRDFILHINQDLFSLYSCDDARYVEYSSYWQFEDLDSGDLLYELGLRDDDENASVRGFDPKTMETATSSFDLDSIDDMLLAYDALSFADGVVLTVDRASVSGGVFTIWITIE